MREEVKSYIPPKPFGDLVVVGADMGRHWTREPKIVKATVIVRDASGTEFSFQAECEAKDLEPYYR